VNKKRKGKPEEHFFLIFDTALGDFVLVGNAGVES
jgi:hypothetical protein